MALFPTPRMVALIPGQSPPDDKIPIFTTTCFYVDKVNTFLREKVGIYPKKVIHLHRFI
jgi:hypothetical protein